MMRSVSRLVLRATIITITLLATLVALPATTLAQTQGAVTGTVLDPSGRTVAGAGIVVRNEATGDVRATATDNTGHFSVAGLAIGAYTVEVGAPGFDVVRKSGLRIIEGGQPADAVIQLTIANVTETVTVSTALPAAAVAAPSQGSLTARSAESLISNEYIRNYTSPFSDYSQVLQMAPGTFSVSANGPGLSDTKTFFRGFPDGFYCMTFDGIPFNDTNDPTHHSWVFFPAQTIGSTVFERSPGSAASIGPSTYGGSVNLLSQPLPSQQTVTGTASYGSFNTRLFDAQFDSGQLGASGKSRLLVEGHQTQSDGYQTFNDIKVDAFSAKYQYAASADTTITAFSSVEDMNSNTPNQKGATRAQIQQFGDNFLMTSDPASPLYYGYNFYRVPTNFEYIGVKTNLGGGWSIDDKVYTMRYHNQQNYNSVTAISTTSAVDKLNAYWKVGNYLPISYVSSLGIFRTGVWTEYADTNRYQIPSDPRTWIDAALPNFHEMFGTTSLQPFAEYELKLGSKLSVTPGVKLAYYRQNFTQFADNGKTVGSLNGAPSTQHVVDYHSWLPSADVHYLLRSSWSVYGQYGKGQNIPPTSIFDVKGALVATLPKPVLSDTFQVGSVWKSNRATLDVDTYRVKLQNAYSATFDPVAGDTLYFPTANTISNGVESESTILVGGGLAVYLNGTLGSARYTDTKQWVQNTPSDTETGGLTFNRGSWNMGLFAKRIGKMYNDNGATHQAVAIDPFGITNLFANYSLGGSSKLAASKMRFAINNLTNSHAITAVSPASTTSNAPAPGDILTLMSGRSVSVSVTVGLAPKRP
jgi:iron complex outermembrane receptor protein